MERCTKCNKKTWVIHNCQCGEKFCLNHRYPESHDCSYDYKGSAKEILNRKLSKVVADKVENRI